MGGGLEGQGQWMYRLGLLGARIVLLVLLSLDAYYAHWFLGAGTPTWVVVGYGVWVFGLFVVPLHWHRWLSWANVRPLADVVLVSVLVIYSGGTSSPLYLLYAMPLNAALCRATRGGSRPAAVLVPLVFLVGYGGASVIAPWCDGPEPDWRLVAFRVVAFAVVLWVIARLYVDDDARLEGIAEGLRNVATRIESRDLATSIAEMVRNRLRGLECSVYLLEREANCYRRWAIAGKPGDRSSAKVRHLARRDDPLARALESRRPVCGPLPPDQVMGQPQGDPVPNRTGVGALLDRFRRDLRPLVAITACFGDHKQGTLEGALEVRRRLWFSEPEEAVFNRFAKAVGAALHRAEERRRHLAAATASFGEDLVEALRFLTAHGAEKLGAEVWTVYLYAQDEDKLVLRYAVGIPWQVVGRVKYGPGEGLTGKAFQDRTAHRYDNPRGTKGWKGIQFREVLAVDPTFQAGPLLIAPISEPTGDVAGVLKVEKPLSADGDQFTATDEEVAVRIGQLIGGVVALHRDRERLRQRARNLEAVVTQQQEIAEAGGQLQALELVHRLVAERAGASVDVLLFWHYQQAASADGSYAFCAGAGCRFTTEMGENENEWRKWSLARGSGLMVHAAESGEPCTYLTHLADSDMPQYLPLRDTKSICIVPIGTGHTVFACLVAESSEPDGVPPDLRAFMQSQAGATGAVIHRFAIFAELLGGHVNHCVSHLSGRLAQMLQRCADHEQGWSLGEASQKDVSGVIAGLLDLVERSRWLVALTAGGLTEVMMPRVVNLADAVGDRVASWRNVRGSPCIEFQADPSGALAASDPDYVAEALDRLLGNAVRLHTPGTPIKVSTSRVNTHVVISVTNSGPGVPLAAQERLFEYGYSHPPGEGHRGMGLWYARQLVEAHRGGRIALVNDSPQLTRFEIRLPCATDEAAEGRGA